jgi:hypothetical protein
MRSLVIALSLLAGITIPASSALAAASPHPGTDDQGSIGIRLVYAPTESNDPRTSSYIIDRLAPGTTLSRRVEIVNSTRSTKNVALYPAAASLRRGKFEFARNRRPNDLSRWTSVSGGALLLPAGTTAFETVTISVPKDASSGRRYAVLWAEVAAPAADGVTLVNRVGIRIYLSVPPEGAPIASVADHAGSRRAIFVIVLVLLLVTAALAFRLSRHSALLEWRL